MNIFQLVFKQMRQRSLSTWLTLFSIMLGVALAIAILIVRREGQNLFVQTDFGYDLIIGPPKGSPLQLTLNTVYHMDQSPGVIPYQIYEDMARKAPPLPGHVDYRRYIHLALPFMVGDSYRGSKIVGTSPLMFGVDDAGKPVADPFQYRLNHSYELEQGRVFGPRKFEAVIGSDVAKKFNMKLYDDKLSPEENQKVGGAFRATHGFPAPNEKPDIHKPVWHVVGILKPTHTANDRVLFIPFISLYAIAEHKVGMDKQAILRGELVTPPEPEKPAVATPGPGGELMKDTADDEDPDAYHLDAKGDIVPDAPQAEWELSAIIVKSRGPVQGEQLSYNFKIIDNRATAVNPAGAMREFFNTFLSSSVTVLLVIACLVTVVAAASIMTTIYNSVSARRREIAILRALGATRRRILVMICVEAGTVGLLGGIAGFVVGHLLGAVGSVILERKEGVGISWMTVGLEELLYLAAVVVIAVVAGLVPALKAYRVSVAANLVAE